MALKCCMSTRNYSRIENGETKNLTVEALNSISEALNISILDLLLERRLIENTITQSGLSNNILPTSQSELKMALDILFEKNKELLENFNNSFSLSTHQQILEDFRTRFPKKE